jgi:hypothetical protein
MSVKSVILFTRGFRMCYESKMRFLRNCDWLVETESSHGSTFDKAP